MVSAMEGSGAPRADALYVAGSGLRISSKPWCVIAFLSSNVSSYWVLQQSLSLEILVVSSQYFNVWDVKIMWKKLHEQ